MGIVKKLMCLIAALSIALIVGGVLWVVVAGVLGGIYSTRFGDGVGAGVAVTSGVLVAKAVYVKLTGAKEKKND